ncbi:MAG: S-layer homology domain-containing protein [Thermoleophilia bacterium]
MGRRKILAACAVLAAVLPLTFTPPPASAFSDVFSWGSQSDAIQDLSSRGVINGYDDGTFRPDNAVWRQHFAKMIVLTLGLPASEADVCPFNDVDVGGLSTLYPDNYIAVAAARGITNGTGSGKFSPTAEISRAQVITMVARAAENLWPGVLYEPPASYAGTWGTAFSALHGPNARKAEYNGLLVGLDLPILDPWGDMPRGEVAQVLHNLLWFAPRDLVTLSGSGDDVVPVSKGIGPAVAHITGNAAEAYFGVTGYDSHQDMLDLLANATNLYEGIRPVDFDVGDHTAMFEVKATGAWNIELRSLGTVRSLAYGAAISGSGDEVIRLLGAPKTLHIVGNTADRYFGVVGYGASWDLLANETDQYDGRVLVDPGVIVLEIQATGPWSITSEP